MVTEKVFVLIEQLRTQIDGFFGSAEKTLLDYSWPSLGFVDFYVYELRNVEVIGDAEKGVIRGAASYIAALAHNCWQLFCKDVIVDIDAKGVFISGTTKDGRKFRVAVEEALTKVLRNKTNKLPVLGKFERYLSHADNVISPFSLGVFLGLSPYGEGSCLDESLESFKDNIDEIIKLLARSCAEHYGFVYPDEPFGQVAELYLHNLIYPPTFMTEGVLVGEAVQGLAEFFKEYRVKENDISMLLLNLFISPDERISLAAYAFYCAIKEEENDKIRLYAASKGNVLGMLRPAVLIARKLLGKEADWISSESFSETERQRYEFEKQSGLLPWVKLNNDTISKYKNDPRMVRLLGALSQFDAVNAKNVLDDMISETPQEIDLVLQRIYLELAQGIFEIAEVESRALVTEPAAEDNYRVYYYWGMADLGMYNPARARLHFEKALSLCAPADDDYPELLTNLAFVAAVENKSDEAERLYLQAVNGAKCRFPYLLLQYKFYIQQKNFDVLRAVQRELLQFPVFDRRVIANNFDVLSDFVRYRPAPQDSKK